MTDNDCDHGQLYIEYRIRSPIAHDSAACVANADNSIRTQLLQSAWTVQDGCRVGTDEDLLAEPPLESHAQAINHIVDYVANYQPLINLTSKLALSALNLTKVPDEEREPIAYELYWGLVGGYITLWLTHAAAGQHNIKAMDIDNEMATA